MKRWCVIILVLLLVYLSTGLYVIGGNQKGAVRRFGKVRMTAAGHVELASSGLHYDFPWPFSQVDRVNVNEVRTISVGLPEDQSIDDGQFLQPVDTASQSQFLTGDKNILNMQLNVHYRVSEFEIYHFLFGTEQPNRRLELLAEAVLAEIVLQSGVDFVHTLGRNELRVLLKAQLSDLVQKHQLGLEIEDVTIGGVYPPIQVKAEFLDVMNARADKETYINQALAYAEQQRADSRAEARKRIDNAEVYRSQTVEEARGSADSFVKVVERFQLDEQRGIQSASSARSMAMRRRYIDTMEEIFRKVSGKVFLDSGKPVDLTIFRDPNE